MKLQSGFDTRRLLSMLAEALSKENELWKPRIYNEEDSGVNADGRDQIVRWLAHLTKKFKFLPETFALAVDIFDRLLQVVKARSKHLKVIGVTCFYLAAKTLQEDNTIPVTLELVRESQCGCSVAEVHRMELIILGKLGWDLRAATALEFMHLFQSLVLSNSPHLLHGYVQMSAARQLSLLTQKLQVALSYHGFVSFSPSTLALALLSLELEMFHKEWFTFTVALESLIEVDNDSLMICREKLTAFLASVPYPKSIYLKASHQGHRLKATTKAAKRKVEEIDDDDVYDAIKRLYNDEEMSQMTAVTPATSTCASEIQQELSVAISVQHQTLVVK